MITRASSCAALKFFSPPDALISRVRLDRAPRTFRYVVSGIIPGNVRPRFRLQVSPTYFSLQAGPDRRPDRVLHSAISPSAPFHGTPVLLRFELGACECQGGGERHGGPELWCRDSDLIA